MTEPITLPAALTPEADQLRKEAELLPYAAPDGQFLQTVGRKYLKNAGIAVFHMIGGVEAMAQWANENKGEFYTKLYPKLLDRTVEVHDHRSIESVIDELDEDTIDADFERV